MTTAPAARADFTADHEAFRDSARRFVNAEIAPHLDDWRRTGSISRAVFGTAGANGFLGTAVPEVFGGGDAEDFGFLAILIEETVDAGSIGLALLWALHAGVTIPVVLDHGTPQDHERWLPGLISGDQIGIPAPGTHAPGLVGGRLADLLLVRHGDVAALLPAPTTGLRVVPVANGLAAPEAGCADIIVDPTVLDTCASVTATGTAVNRDLDLWFAVVALAAARKTLGLALEYVVSRRVFGTLLADFENTQMRLGQLTAELISATTHVDRCVAARGHGRLTALDAAAARQVAVALSERTADQSLQLHGGYGYMREYPIAQAFADARFVSTVGRQYSDPRHTVAAGLFNAR